MSLINKVLKDLETRKDAPSRNAPRQAIFEGIRPTTGMGPAARRSRMLVIVAAIAVVVGGVYAWQQGGLANGFERASQWLASITSTEPVVTKAGSVAMEPAPAAPESPVPSSESATATAPPAEPVIPPPPVAEAAKPASEPANTRPLAETAGATPVAPATTTGPVEPAAGDKIAAAPKAESSKPVEAAKPAPKPEAAKPMAASKPAVGEKPAALPAKKTKTIGAGEGGERIEKKERPQTAEELAEGAYREGVRFMQQGRPAQADQSLRLALTHDPKHLSARELLAGLQLEQGRSHDARVILEQGLVQVPEHVPFAQLLARLYVDQGAEQSAVTVLEGVRARGADQPEYLALLATVYQRIGRQADAVEAYRQALGLRPQEGRWWLGLGISLEAQKNFPAASEAYQRAKAGVLDPKLARYAEQRLAALNR